MRGSASSHLCPDSYHLRAFQHHSKLKIFLSLPWNRSQRSGGAARPKHCFAAALASLDARWWPDALSVCVRRRRPRRFLGASSPKTPRKRKAQQLRRRRRHSRARSCFLGGGVVKRDNSSSRRCAMVAATTYVLPWRVAPPPPALLELLESAVVPIRPCSSLSSPRAYVSPSVSLSSREQAFSRAKEDIIQRIGS